MEIPPGPGAGGPPLTGLDSTLTPEYNSESCGNGGGLSRGPLTSRRRSAAHTSPIG